LEEIKIKKKPEKPIKKIDKTIYKDKLKKNLINIKQKNEMKENENSNEYAENIIEETTTDIVNDGIKTFDKYGRKSLDDIRNNFNNKNIEIKNVKVNNGRVLKENKSRFIKANTRVLKTSNVTGKKTLKSVKNTRKATSNAVNSIKVVFKNVKNTFKKVVVGIRRVISVSILAVKATIVATKTLIAFLLAGGWIAVIIIVIVCLVALVCTSVYGIFFSSEDVGNKNIVVGTQNILNMSNVVSNINLEFLNKIIQIKNSNVYDEYRIKSNQAEWKEVLAFYSVKLNEDTNKNEIVTLDFDKVEQIKEIFWEMNEINFVMKDEIIQTEEETITKRILEITIDGKSIDEMANKYNFNKEQRNQLKELTSEKYSSMWVSVIYGVLGNCDIVKVAKSQLGNLNGDVFWSWYGYTSRVDWCACFVSWCGNECGYIEAGIIPKFSNCDSGVKWFKSKKRWKQNDYIPKSRRYYIF